MLLRLTQEHDSNAQWHGIKSWYYHPQLGAWFVEGWTGGNAADVGVVPSTVTWQQTLRFWLDLVEQGTFFGGLFVGFYYNWKLTLVILSFLPLMMYSAGMVQVSPPPPHPLHRHGDFAGVPSVAYDFACDSLALARA